MTAEREPNFLAIISFQLGNNNLGALSQSYLLLAIHTIFIAMLFLKVSKFVLIMMLLFLSVSRAFDSVWKRQSCCVRKISLHALEDSDKEWLSKLFSEQKQVTKRLLGKVDKIEKEMVNLKSNFVELKSNFVELKSKFVKLESKVSGLE
jgi:peptidoglycan hydrolase CwlO-like protein